MTVVLDERGMRQARARAVAASILDMPRRERVFEIPEQLRPSPRRRLRGRRVVVRHPRVRLGGGARASARRRLLAIAVLAALVAALVGALTLPTFRVATVGVSGNRILSHDALVRTSGIGARQSIFTVDAEGARRHLLANPWVRSADVVTELPATVRITVTEDTPTLRVKRTSGDVLVAADGNSMAVADAVPAAIPAGLPTLVDQRPVAAGSAPPPLDPDLLHVLADTAARFPAVFGVAVSSFRWQPDGLLSIVAVPGWRAILGSMATTDDIAFIPEQLASLAALRARLDLAHPTFGYIDLEDPAAPAVGGAPGQPQPAPAPAQAAPVPAAGASPSPIPVTPRSPAPAPTAAAAATPGAPTPRPAATPIVVPVTH